jgi:hypothetical protein
LVFCVFGVGLGGGWGRLSLLRVQPLVPALPLFTPPSFPLPPPLPSGAVLAALARHPRLRKLTILRPEGIGEPIRKNQCVLIGKAMTECRSLVSVHIRRAGMWTDTLAALTPPRVALNITCLKLDSNSLAYLSANFFNEAMDGLLSKLPNLRALHLGNNQLDTAQSIALAASLTSNKICHLESITLGSNEIGDAGLAAILKALPGGMQQLYLHGTQITDQGVAALSEALQRMPNLWGLGLNGNPVSDVGVAELAGALKDRPALQDVGITLSDMSDAGATKLGEALATCPSLRFVYLYSQGEWRGTGGGGGRAGNPAPPTELLSHPLQHFPPPLSLPQASRRPCA